MSAPLSRRVERRGNAFLITLTEKDLEALGIVEGEEVELSAGDSASEVDWDALPRVPSP